MSPAVTPSRRVLAVASECAPLIKTGGLADVVGALPLVLSGEGWSIRTLIPGYRRVLSTLRKPRAVMEFPDLLGVPARLLATQAAGLDLLVLDSPALFDRDGSPYLDASGNDWPDNDLRFAALCKAAALVAADGIKGWQPDVVHLHDWQAGLTPVYMRMAGAPQPCLLTIHNIAFHGLTGGERLAALDLPPEAYSMDGVEYYGHISALKGGLTGARAINTVSPTYAQELRTEEFGMGLEGVIRARSADLSGILNGIDTGTWNPANDPAVKPFTAPAGKGANARALRAEFGLDAGDGPLAVVISRLSDQKGLDLLLAALPALVDAGGQLALLGSGDRRLENAWLTAAAGMAGRVAVRIGYDEALSHRMYAGADAVLVPSRFEPCGLTQMYGLRYGAIPVVARTGGLADTVIHANAAALAAGCATGIVHAPHSADALAQALRDLCTLYADAPTFRRMQKNAMKHPVGWEASAPRYAALYARLADSLPEPI
ncbi:MAG: glycogen synthase GlgA [Rhodobacteraceae bacterium]|nr:glycogen synthase GlgA [Paracoccaceae bacterium]